MDILQAMYGTREDRGRGMPLTPDTGDDDTAVSPAQGGPVQKVREEPRLRFWRMNNPILWIAAAGIGYFLWKQKQGGSLAPAVVKKKGNPALAAGNPRRALPSGGQVGFCGMGANPMRNPTGDMFTQGNTKLGKKMWAFSLPRVTTCPGRSEWCKKHCYMEKIERLYKATKSLYQRNFELTKKADFPQRAISELSRRSVRNGIHVVRIHVDGDFYNEAYIQKWITIVQAFPTWKFYGYTKSWRVKKLLPILTKFKNQPNVILRASTDESTEKPPAGWLEAGIGECLTAPKAYSCHFYDTSIQCDTCKVCSTRRVSIALKAH